MDLILWRHADAGATRDGADGEDDLLRPLSKKGEKQATRIAQWLDRQLPDQVRVLCSPATRTDQTAKALGRPYKHRVELLPGASSDGLIELAISPKLGKSAKYTGALVLVGHQPMLGQAAAKLLGTVDSDMAIKKGCVWWFRIRQTVPSDQPVAQTTVTLVTVMSPEHM